MKKKSDNILKNILQGWTNIFNGKSEQDGTRLKDMPENHFYTPEELEYLSQSKDADIIDRWAIAAGKAAYQQSRNKGESMLPFKPVKWVDGLMVTWIDGKLVPDDIKQQAEKLSILKTEGYDIPEKYGKIIKEYEANSLVGNYFKEDSDNSIIMVENCKRNSIADTATQLVVKKWDKDNLSIRKENIESDIFKREIGKSIILMSDEEKKDFNQKLNDYEKGKVKLNKTIGIISESTPTITDGKLPLEYQKIHNTNSEHGKILPTNWVLLGKDLLRIYAYAEDKKDIYSIDLKESNAYKYQSVLDTIRKAVENERINNGISSIISILGNKMGENKIYARNQNTTILETEQGKINAVVTTKYDSIIGFNLDTHEEIPLSAKDKSMLSIKLREDAENERQRIRDVIGIPLMKDYVESLRNEENVFSGEEDYLPPYTTLDKLWCEYEKKSEEYHDFSCSPLRLCDEDLDKLKEDLMNSHMLYKKEMVKMVNAYKNKDYTISDKDVEKVNELDKVLGNDRKSSIKYVKDKQLNESNPQDNKEQKITEELRNEKTEIVGNIRYVKPSIMEPERNGRWHTQELLERKAYQRYGILLSGQQDNSNEKRVSNAVDIYGKRYNGVTAMILSMESKRQRFDIPVFIKSSEMESLGIKVREDAIGIPVIGKGEVYNFYNIDQTDYPIKFSRHYNEIKIKQEVENRIMESSKDMVKTLVNNDRFTTKTKYDASESSAIYDDKENTIHIASEDKYENKDNYFQDLSECLIKSTRRKEEKSLRIEGFLKEELIATIGSKILGLKYGFETNNKLESKYWQDRLRKDPEYTKEVLRAAEKSSATIIKYIETIKNEKEKSSDLDLRSSTPVDMDTDGNGIVDSQENLEPDKKNNSESEKEEHHFENRVHKGR